MQPERLVIAFDAALRKTGQSSRSAVSRVLPILIRLVLIALFLWYLVEFVLVLFLGRHWLAGVLLAVAVLALAILFISACVKTRSEYNAVPAQDTSLRPSVRPYIYAVLLPVLTVLISTIWNVQYSTPLLWFTRKIFEVLSL